MKQNSVEILRGVFYSQECIAKKLMETQQKFCGNVSNMYVDSAYTYRILWRFCLTTTLITLRQRFFAHVWITIKRQSLLYYVHTARNSTVRHRATEK